VNTNSAKFTCACFLPVLLLNHIITYIWMALGSMPLSSLSL
jgi:hypothetical protein